MRLFCDAAERARIGIHTCPGGDRDSVHSADVDDEKPNHGSPDYAREVAFQKITNRVQGARAAAAEHLGVN